MFSENLIDTIVNSASKENIMFVFRELAKSLKRDYHGDECVSHLLEMLVNINNILSINDIDLTYVKEHLDIIKYNSKDFNIKDIRCIAVDNIRMEAEIEYKYLEKVNEDRADVSYTTTTTSLPLLTFDELLKKS